MNKPDFDLLRRQDQGLREALSQEAAEQPPMPADLNERLMERIGQQSHPAAVHRHTWLYTAIAAAAGVALLLSLHLIYSKEEQTTELPVVAQLERKAQPTVPEGKAQPTVSEGKAQPFASEGKAPPSAPEGATIKSSLDSKTIEAPSGAVGGASGASVALTTADKQALADIYLAEVALQVAYQQLEQQQAVEAYASSLVEEEAAAQPIIAF